MKMRPLFFAMYGALAGMVELGLFYGSGKLSPIGAALCGLGLSVLLAYWGYRASRSSSGWEPKLFLVIPLAPYVFLASFFGLCIVLLPLATLYIVLWPFFLVRWLYERRRLRRFMKSKGRFLAGAELWTHLRAGDGTIIEEMGHKGPYRIWWTEENVPRLGQPAPSKEEFINILRGKEHAFNSYCLREYIDPQTGRAKLTPLPPRYIRSGKLEQEFPRARVIKVVWKMGDGLKVP